MADTIYELVVDDKVYLKNLSTLSVVELDSKDYCDWIARQGFAALLKELDKTSPL